MDGLYRLFCGCCGLAGEPEPPYAQLRHDSVTPVRDPPLQQNNGHHHHQNQQQQQFQYGLQNQQNPHNFPQDALHHQQQGFVNPVHELPKETQRGRFQVVSRASFRTLDQPDGHDESDSGSQQSLEEETAAADESREKEQLDNIVESTQHSIIAVGQTDVDGVIMMDTQHREKAYKQKCQKMALAPPTTFPYEPMYDFHLEPTQTPIQVPLRYDEMSATIDANPIERMPFACPDFQQLRLARTMGARNGQFLVEHPDLKAAGRSQGINHSAKAKVTEVLDEVHKGVIGIEVEPRDLIVSMDF